MEIKRGKISDKAATDIRFDKQRFGF